MLECNGQRALGSRASWASSRQIFRCLCPRCATSVRGAPSGSPSARLTPQSLSARGCWPRCGVIEWCGGQVASVRPESHRSKRPSAARSPIGLSNVHRGSGIAERRASRIAPTMRALMFRDQDKWPVYCPLCGEVTLKEIGWLKTNTSLNCGGCGKRLRYYQERMNRDLEDAQRAVESFSRSLLVEK